MMTRDMLLRRLDQAGATGLDMSPGDELAAEAAVEIRRLVAQFTNAVEEEREACARYVARSNVAVADALRQNRQSELLAYDAKTRRTS